MASDGQIVFEVTADGKHAIADIKDITKAIQQETGKWDKAADDSANHIGGSFDSMLKKLAAGFSMAKIGKALLDFGKAAVSAASDLEEVQNVVDVTFGDSAGKIEAWAKNASKQFGLTETQAKRFTSTMGAMLKSSGMAGDEITQVSTDLAGLAADMASFYNLDFEEAFSKIRSGISGQTMPLKELGIDMSVATLNAYALQKGLTKTFDQMSQAEQTMLRYQYLMSATADAQGDFARTSDSYANKVRNLQSNIESIKTALGQAFLTPVTEATSVLNNLLEKLVPTEDKTILDKVAEIDINKETKLKEIEEVAAVVGALLADMQTIGSNKDAAQTVTNLANGANALNSSSATNWQGVLSALQGIDGLENLFGDNSTATQNISDLALALSGHSPTMTQAEAWQTLLGAMSDNAEAVSALTGDSVSGTKEWLAGLAESAKELKPGDVAAWQQLMGALLSGVDLESEKGHKFVESLVNSFLAMGSGSEEAVAALSALGFTTDEISDKQAQWLAYCKELVKTIPGLSSIIDTNTGEVKGGIPAIKAYADEWERTAKYQAQIEAIRAKKELYNEVNNPTDLSAAASVARSKAVFRLQQAGYDDTEINTELAKLDQLMLKTAEAGRSFEDVKQSALDVKTTLGFDVDTVSGATVTQMQSAQIGADSSEFNWINSLKGEAETAVLDYAKALHEMHEAEIALPIINEQLDNEMQQLAEEAGLTTDEINAQTDAAKEAEQELTKYEKALKGDADAETELVTAINNANEALKAMTDYAENMRKSMEDAVNSVVKGFERVDYHTYKQISDNIDSIRNSLSGLEEGSDEWEKQHKELEKYNNQLITTASIYKNLESQKQFLDDYIANLSKAQAMGLNAQLLAELSDGSVESAMYLDALVNDTTSGVKIKDINDLYEQIQAQKKELSGKLTDNQLSVDQVYQGLVEDAKKAVDELGTLGVPAADNAKAMVDAIAAGVSEEQVQVKNAVDGIISEFDRLSNLSYSPSITLGLGGLFSFFIPHLETGLDRVPFDGYLASLHEGEGVLTAEENRVWQRFKNGQGNNAFDYDTMGGVMRDNIKAGGNVYLDGRVVGSVISDQQGKTYRQLQRSGWQG